MAARTSTKATARKPAAATRTGASAGAKKATGKTAPVDAIAQWAREVTGVTGFWPAGKIGFAVRITAPSQVESARGTTVDVLVVFGVGSARTCFVVFPWTALRVDPSRARWPAVIKVCAAWSETPYSGVDATAGIYRMGDFWTDSVDRDLVTRSLENLVHDETVVWALAKHQRG